MIKKPIILAMEAPFIGDPTSNLLPLKVGGNFHSLWWMMAKIRKHTTQEAFINAFQFISLMDVQDWKYKTVSRKIAEVKDSMKNGDVIMLGQEVLRAMELPSVEPLLWQQSDNHRWCFIPSVTRQKHWFLDDINRIGVGLRLEELVEAALVE